jgi:outer membrane protein, multidrug efflux system
MMINKPIKRRHIHGLKLPMACAMFFSLFAASQLYAKVKVPSADQMALPSSYNSQLNGSQTSATPLNPESWWEGFNDEQLNALVEKAVAENLDIVQALERLEQSRQSWRQSRSDQLPTVDAGVSGNRSDTENTNSIDRYSAQIDARWNIDLFGTRRQSVRASKAAFDAAGFNLADIRNAVAAEVVRNYVDGRSLANRLLIARDTLIVQDNNLAIAQWRAQAGLVSSIDVEQARAQRAQTAVGIINLERSLATSAHRLALLTAQVPGQLNYLYDTKHAVPEIPALSSVGVPADLLRLRPDVRAAEQNLLGAAARLGVAKSQLFPALNLSASLNSSAASFSKVGELLTSNILISLAQTLFDGGKRRALIRSRESEARQSLAAYESSILAALEEVENAVVSSNAAQARVSQLAVQENASARVAQLRRERYRTGLNDFTSLLDAERSLLSARDSLATAQADLAFASIQLHLALGGGWNPQQANDQTLLQRTNIKNPSSF